MKRCSKCRTYKPFSAFTKNTQRLKYDGLELWCKACKKVYNLSKTSKLHFAQTLPEALYRFFTPGKPDECWPWEGCIDSEGYGYIGFKSKAYKAHRVAWSTHRGSIPTGLFVCHHCDVRSCVNYVDHLFLGTCADNSRDAAIKGRAAKKLNVPEDIRLIRQLFSTMTWAEIAKKFDVHISLIAKIKSGLCHRHTK